MLKSIEVHWTFSKIFRIAEFQGINSLCPTKSERLKFCEIKIYSKAFQNITKLMDYSTYFQFKIISKVSS